MKILMFSLGPLFPEHVHGGAQKTLRDIALGLGRKGHIVDIYCTRREDNFLPFELASNVTVNPSLRFKQVFPSPYYTGPYNIGQIIAVLLRSIKEHDVIYIHDAGLNIPSLCHTHKPSVISLRDFMYPETLLGAFNFERDKVIVNSTYTRDALLSTAGKVRPGLENRVIVIENGIDLDLFKRTKGSLSSEIGILEKDIVILYPHRPDEKKGILPALEIIKRLKYKRGLKEVRLLVPDYIDRNVSEELNPHYERIKKFCIENGIEENVSFHGWLPYERMPEYFTIGKLTLSIGNFIEGFGSNTTLESMACGTPAIISRVGAMRTTLPEGIVTKADFGDLDFIEEEAMKLLTSRFDVTKAREYIAEHFSYDVMLDAYEKEITQTQLLSPLPLVSPKKTDTFSLAPWCYLSEKGIYHDYEYRFLPKDRFYEFINHLKGDKFDSKLAEADGFNREMVNEKLERGIIIEV